MRSNSSLVLMNLLTSCGKITKAYRQNVMMIRIHKGSDRKIINAIDVKDFKLVNKGSVLAIDNQLLLSAAILISATGKYSSNRKH